MLNSTRSSSIETNETMNIFIEIDEKMYSPGDRLTGSLIVKLSDKRKLFVDEIVIQFYGAARVLWIEDQIKPPNLRQRVPFEQTRVFIDEKVTVFDKRSSKDTIVNGDNSNADVDRLHRALIHNSQGLRIKNVDKINAAADDRAHLSPGNTHRFAFEFRIPSSGIPTSFDASQAVGCVRYSVQALFKENGIIKLRRKQLFPIVAPVDLNAISAASRATERCASRVIKKSSLFGVLFDKVSNKKKKSMKEKRVVVDDAQSDNVDQSVSAKLSLLKCGYVPGEPLLASVTIDNRSQFSIKFAHLSLVQMTSCYANFGQKTTQFQTSGVGMPNDKLRQGESIQFNPIYRIGALTPNFDIDHCISVEYFVQLEIGFNRRPHKITALCIQLPIIIGTIPINTNRLLSLKETEMNVAAGGVPPPAYDWPMIDFQAPPTYEESIAGISLIDIDNTSQLPRYPVYRFDIESDNNRLVVEDERDETNKLR